MKSKFNEGKYFDSKKRIGTRISGARLKIPDLGVPLTGIDSPEARQIAMKEFEKANSYENIRQDRLRKLFDNPRSNFRRVGDYIWKNIYLKVELDKKEICKDLKISIGACNRYISYLNFSNRYPLTIVPVKHKKDFIRAISSDRGDYVSWKKRKFRTMTSMGVVYDKGVTQGERVFENTEEEEKRVVVEVKKKRKNDKQEM